MNTKELKTKLENVKGLLDSAVDRYNERVTEYIERIDIQKILDGD